MDDSDAREAGYLEGYAAAAAAGEAILKRARENWEDRERDLQASLATCRERLAKINRATLERPDDHPF